MAGSILRCWARNETEEQEINKNFSYIIHKDIILTPKYCNIFNNQHLVVLNIIYFISGSLYKWSIFYVKHKHDVT